MSQKPSASANRVICWTEEQKNLTGEIVNDPEKFRALLSEFFKQFPELTPQADYKWVSVKRNPLLKKNC